jgi:hypothetical protein
MKRATCATAICSCEYSNIALQLWEERAGAQSARR